MKQRAYHAPEGFLDRLLKEKSVCVIGHTNPDADCLSSALALAIFLRSRGVDAVAATHPAKVGHPLLRQHEIATAIPAEATAVVLVDCATADRCSLGEEIGNQTLYVIDHHKSSILEDSASDDERQRMWIEPDAPAAALLVGLLIQRADGELSKEIAELIFAGIAADSGYFKFLDETQQSIFTLAGDCVKAGVNPRATYELIFGGRSASSLELFAQLISRAESHLKHRLYVVTETPELMAEYGDGSRDGGRIFDHFLSMGSCHVVAYIKYQANQTTSISLRSKFIDVAAVAEQFGGGGHHNAAGLSVKKPIEEIKGPVVEALIEALELYAQEQAGR